MTNCVKIHIEKMVFGGDGMGHLEDGRAIFVPFTLPGEIVEVEVIEEKKRFARGKLLEILTPSNKRIHPHCKHFGLCGGCHYQMLGYNDQIMFKEEILIDQFKRIANIDIEEKLTIIRAPQEWNYRQTIQLHTCDGGIGFQRAGSNEVIPVSECFLPVGDFNDLREMLVFEEDSGIAKVQIRRGDEDDLMVVLSGLSPAAPEMELDMPASILYRYEDSDLVLAGEDFQTISISGIPFIVSADSFFQASTEMAGMMVSYLIQELSLKKSDLLLDLYCGVGIFSRFLGEKISTCVGIEFSSSAVSDFAENLDSLDDVQIFEGLVEDILPDLDIQPDICVIDPPRAGVHPIVIDELSRMEIPFLAYVSCDPSTQARDVKRLTSQGYRFISAALFDQFPQTYHMETILIMQWEGK